MSTSKDNSRKLPQNCVYQKESDKKGNKKHQPSHYFFQISFPWDPSIASVSINRRTLFTQRSPRQSVRGAHSLHCQDATKTSSTKLLREGDAKQLLELDWKGSRESSGQILIMEG